MINAQLIYLVSMDKKRAEVKAPQTVATFASRIREAMRARGWEPTAPVLRREWEKRYTGNPAPPTRQAFHRWFHSDGPQIEPANLYYLADLLGVNARFLVFYDTQLRNRMEKPVFPDDELKMLIDIYYSMRKPYREKLLRDAEDLLLLQKSGDG